MAATINIMRKTSREWEEENPVVPYDMLGIEELETGGYKIKRGDGVTGWAALEYFISGGVGREECDNIVDDYTVDQRSSIPVPNKAAVYNEHKGLKSDKPPTEENDVVRLTELQNADAALQQTLDDEEAARESADDGLENSIENINTKIGALNGAYFVLEPYNFGKNLDAQDNDDVLILNTYAISQTPGASSTSGLNDNTVIINEFDNSEFIYNKQLDVWLFHPNGVLTIATNQSLGVVKGVSDPYDGSKDGAVAVNLHGEMEVVGFTILKGRVADAEGAAADEEAARESADTALQQALDDEEAARKEAVEAETTARNEAIADASFASQTQLPDVQTKAELPDPATLSAAATYLCRVVDDPNPAYGGVWRRPAGASGWTFYSGNYDVVRMPSWTEFTSPAASGTYTGRMSGPYFTRRIWPNGKRVMRMEAVLDGYKPSTSSTVIHESVTPAIPGVAQKNIVNIGGSIRVQDTSNQPYHMPLNIGGVGSALPGNFRVMVSYNAFQLYSVNCGLVAASYQVVMWAEWFEK